MALASDKQTKSIQKIKSINSLYDAVYQDCFEKIPYAQVLNKYDPLAHNVNYTFKVQEVGNYSLATLVTKVVDAVYKSPVIQKIQELKTSGEHIFFTEKEMEYLKALQDTPQEQRYVIELFIFAKQFPHPSSWIEYHANYIFRRIGLYRLDPKEKQRLIQRVVKLTHLDFKVVGLKKHIPCYNIKEIELDVDEEEGIEFDADCTADEILIKINKRN